MNNRNFFILLIVLSAAGFCAAKNILFISGLPSPSHYIWNRAIFAELVKKGYNVTVLSTDIDESNDKHLHFFQLEKVYDDFFNNDDIEINFLEIGQMNPILVTYQFAEIGINLCDSSLKSSGFKDLMSYPDNFKFDAVIYDYLAGPCMLVLLEKFNNPPLIAVTAFISPTTAAMLTGSMFYPAFVPNIELEFEVEMNLWERTGNFLMYLLEYYLKYFYVNPQIDYLVRSKFPAVPYLGELEQRTKIVLLNSNPVLDYVEPFLPNVIGVGGLQISATKPLPDNLQKIFDNTKNGVILFSLGTNMRSDLLGKERLTHILTAFKELPQYDIIWKFESNDLPIPVPANVHIHSWIPQNDILANPKTLLFVTHNGMLSTQEAIWHGVPMVGLPIFGDQFQNINQCVKFGTAKRLSIRNITADKLRDTVLTVLTNPSYKKNVSERSRIFRDQPQTPLDRAVWWIEWVLRNPGSEHLKSPSMKLGILAQHSVDVIILLTIASFGTFALFFYIIKRCFRCCSGSKKSKKLKYQ